MCAISETSTAFRITAARSVRPNPASIIVRSSPPPPDSLPAPFSRGGSKKRNSSLRLRFSRSNQNRPSDGMVSRKVVARLLRRPPGERQPSRKVSHCS